MVKVLGYLLRFSRKSRLNLRKSDNLATMNPIRPLYHEYVVFEKAPVFLARMKSIYK